MENKGKYSINSSEDYEPGSNNLVLKNKLGIIDKTEIELQETIALEKAYNYFVDYFSDSHKFDDMDIKFMHKIWLQNIYSWAGEYRSVNMSKGGFLFSVATQIPKLMAQFSSKYLALYTPCLAQSKEQVADALAITHIELILIHPFREGNGRLSRMFASIMAMQAGLPPLNFYNISNKDSESYDRYIKAIHDGLDGSYTNMRKILIEEIIQTLTNGD